MMADAPARKQLLGKEIKNWGKVMKDEVFAQDGGNKSIKQCNGKE